MRWEGEGKEVKGEEGMRMKGSENEEEGMEGRARNGGVDGRRREIVSKRVSESESERVAE